MPTLGLNGDIVNTSPFTTAACSTFTGAPYVPPVISSSQSFVTANGSNILITSNVVAAHNSFGFLCAVSGSHTTPTGTPPPPAPQPPISFNEGQTFVTINGVPIAMNGDSANCSTETVSHTLSGTGPAWITITL